MGETHILSRAGFLPSTVCFTLMGHHLHQIFSFSTFSNPSNPVLVSNEFFHVFRLRYTNQAFSGHVENAICKTITFVLFISAAGSKANSFLPWLDAIESLISKIRVKPWQKLAAWWKLLELPLKTQSKQKHISKDCTDKRRILWWNMFCKTMRFTWN